MGARHCRKAKLASESPDTASTPDDGETDVSDGEDGGDPGPCTRMAL
jgi:hypothetical protein